MIVTAVQLLPRRTPTRRYSDDALRTAFAAVESAACYVDPSHQRSRSVRERFGRFVGPYFDADGTLCAKEFHYSESHEFARNLRWLLTHDPSSIGFRINAAEIARPDAAGVTVVEAVQRVRSFDLVDSSVSGGGGFAVRESTLTPLGRDPTVSEIARRLFGGAPEFDAAGEARRLFR